MLMLSCHKCGRIGLKMRGAEGVNYLYTPLIWTGRPYVAEPMDGRERRAPPSCLVSRAPETFSCNF